MTDLTQTLRQMASLFDTMGIPYALMGGMAVRAYGIPRPTYDVDFTIAVDRRRLPELYQAVRDLGYTVPEEYAGGWVDQVGSMPLIKFRTYLTERSIDIDIFLAESAFQEQLLARRRQGQLDESPVWFVSPEDLILLKLVAGRPRDLADAGDVLFTQERLDENYMRRWADKLGVLPALETILTDSTGI
jgi:Nucleotidyl transferase AbiEii toxin, Type IV TA system